MGDAVADVEAEGHRLCERMADLDEAGLPHVDRAGTRLLGPHCPSDCRREALTAHSVSSGWCEGQALETSPVQAACGAPRVGIRGFDWMKAECAHGETEGASRPGGEAGGHDRLLLSLAVKRSYTS